MFDDIVHLFLYDPENTEFEFVFDIVFKKLVTMMVDADLAAHVRQAMHQAPKRAAA